MATKTASNDPETTRQYAGHIAHKKHLAEQEAERRGRRADKARLKAKDKRV
jgi:hypothetical protein